MVIMKIKRMVMTNIFNILDFQMNIVYSYKAESDVFSNYFAEYWNMDLYVNGNDKIVLQIIAVRYIFKLNKW